MASYIASIDSPDVRLDSECTKVCNNKREDESYGWCLPAGDTDAQDATNNNNAAADGSDTVDETTEDANDAPSE